MRILFNFKFAPQLTLKKNSLKENAFW